MTYHPLMEGKVLGVIMKNRALSGARFKKKISFFVNLFDEPARFIFSLHIK